jgi:hypothetical protein
MTTRSVPGGKAVSACQTIAGSRPETSLERARHVALAIDAGEDDDGRFHRDSPAGAVIR